MRTLAAVILSSACALAQAQAPMYRSIMPDGKTVISDRPMPGAKKVEEIKISPGNYAPGDPVPKTAKKPAVKDRTTQRDESMKDVEQAQRAYDQALQKQARGREEGPGDRIGVAGGGARRSDAYDERQKALAEEVDAARKRLEEAQQAAQRWR